MAGTNRTPAIQNRKSNSDYMGGLRKSNKYMGRNQRKTLAVDTNKNNNCYDHL